MVTNDIPSYDIESLDVGNSQNSSMQGCSPGRNDTGRSVEASCSTQKPLLSGNSDLMVSLKRKRNVANKNPMQHFHLQHLWVTDVSSQSWCELQVVHGFEKPDVRKTVNDDPVVLAGSSVHLARELEEHDVVSVSTESREDHWAAKFLNVLTGLTMLKESGRVRELPVFGQVEGIFLVGVIDELHYSPKGELTLSELKTRLRKSLPSAAQRRTHDLQFPIREDIICLNPIEEFHPEGLLTEEMSTRAILAPRNDLKQINAKIIDRLHGKLVKCVSIDYA
ncbi:EXO5 Exonuclease, partial [Polypterus senegalus]